MNESKVEVAGPLVTRYVRDRHPCLYEWNYSISIVTTTHYQLGSFVLICHGTIIEFLAHPRLTGPYEPETSLGSGIPELRSVISSCDFKFPIRSSEKVHRKGQGDKDEQNRSKDEKM